MYFGEMAEWLNAAVLKTVIPGVRYRGVEVDSAYPHSCTHANQSLSLHHFVPVPMRINPSLSTILILKLQMIEKSKTHTC